MAPVAKTQLSALWLPSHGIKMSKQEKILLSCFQLSLHFIIINLKRKKKSVIGRLTT